MSDGYEVRHPEVASLVYELAVGFKRLLADVAEAVDLHPTDLEALRRLHTEADRPGVQELGARLHLSSAAVTGLVDRLERAGHVQRVRDPHDRRRVRVEPTAASAGAMMAGLESHLTRLDAALDDLDADGERHMVESLRLLLGVLEPDRTAAGE